ncbi:MAG: DNA alkylation repair protein [Chloroflexaceae bacterium]|nr:DNA alkylation repair protein [Chloroflexaceae bacterium]
MSETPKFKDYFGIALAHRLAGDLQAQSPCFDAPRFVERIAANVDPLELKGRVALFSTALREHLPPTYPEALDVLAGILGPELPAEAGMFDLGFHLMPVAHFVEVYGSTEPDHFERSLQMINAITRRHTGEFAIRPYLIHYPDRTLPVLRQWASDPNTHVRRLVSEGSRPRLPWASQIPAFIKDPSPIFALLELLKDDPSPYVRKSVANNLNDITKDHPEQVLAVVARWQTDASPERRWIIRHALRTLIKRGDPAALQVLTIDRPQVALVQFSIAPATLQLGESLMLDCTLQSTAAHAQNLVIDYVVHHVRANGSTGPKVFKLRNVTIGGGEQITIQKRHPMRLITTRRYYPGLHRIELQVNGEIVGEAAFTLQV